MKPIDAYESLTTFPVDDDFLDMSETEEYRLTPWGCLSVILDNYGVDYSGVTPTIGKHLVEDFLNLMEKSGHLKYISE